MPATEELLLALTTNTNLTDGSERSRVDAHDDSCPYAVVDGDAGGVSTQQPCKLRSRIFPGMKMPLDGRRQIMASPPQLNRARRRRSSSGVLRSDMFIRSYAARDCLRMASG